MSVLAWFMFASSALLKLPSRVECECEGESVSVERQHASEDVRAREQLAAMEARLRAAEAELAELERMDAQMAART